MTLRQASIGAALLSLLAGCGSDHPPASGPARGTGGLHFEVRWPSLPASPARLVPAAAQSIVVVVLQNGLEVARTNPPIVRPQSGYSFPTIPAGPIVIQARAYPTAQADGNPVASGTVQAVVVAGKDSQAPTLTMATTVARVTHTPTALRYGVGSTQPLTPVAYDAAGGVVLVAPSAWRYDSSRPTVVTADGQGQAAALAPGLATMTITDQESGKRVQVPITVTADIAFTSNRDGNDEIYVLDSTHGGQGRLTNDAASDVAPTWSPDGKLIAFQSDRNGTPHTYLMAADGTNVRRMIDFTSYILNETDPAWSPDGHRIAFVFHSTLTGSYGILSYCLDNSQLINIVDTMDAVAAPCWSSDGHRLAYSRNDAGDWTIHAVDADGTHDQVLINTPAIGFLGGRDGAATWSKQGNKVAFETDRGYGVSHLLDFLDLDGANRFALAPANHCFNPSWSPDGTRLVYDAERVAGGQVSHSLYVDRVDGSGETRLTTGTYDQDPDWCRTTP